MVKTWILAWDSVGKAKVRLGAPPRCAYPCLSPRNSAFQGCFALSKCVCFLSHHIGTSFCRDHFVIGIRYPPRVDSIGTPARLRYMISNISN